MDNLRKCRRTLIIVFLCCAPIGLFAQSNDALLARVLSSSPPEHSYQFRADYEEDDNALSVRIDPSRREGERVVVLAPTDTSTSDYATQKVLQLEAEPMPAFWCAEMATMIPADAKRIDESDGTVTYQFAPKPDPEDEEDAEFMAHILATAEIDKVDGAILQFEMHAPKSFKPAMVAKIKEFRYFAECDRAPEGATYLKNLRVQIAGSAFFKSFEQFESRKITELESLAESSGAHDGPAMNFHRISEQLATSGHLLDGGLDTIRAAGVKVVIDLRDKPPEGQKALLAERGIEWINVPVVWKDPRPEDFAKFKAAMQENEGASILVQCQANYRASAMTYMYRVGVAGIPAATAQADLLAIWTPNSQWQSYIDQVVTPSE